MKNTYILPSIIDSLTDSIERFSILKNEETFENELGSIVSKMASIEIDKTSDENWETLQSNYSKLKYLYEIIDSHKLSLIDTKFIENLSKFMEQIDKQTIFYLREINFEDTDGQSDIISQKIIKKYFEESLNQNNPFEKLKLVIHGYRLLVIVAEKIRKEKLRTFLEDDFLEVFDPVKKRRRI